MPANLVAEWERLMADRRTDRGLALRAITYASICGAMLATIGVAAMLMSGWRS